jgi:hypothetical protein
LKKTQKSKRKLNWREKNLGKMPPSRCVERPMPDLTVEREMRELCALFDAMEIAQGREPDVGDISEAESEEVGAE